MCGVNILEIFAIVLVIDSSVYILVREVLEDKRQIVGVQKQLGQIFVFEDILEKK